MKAKLKQITFLESLKSVRKKTVPPSVVFKDRKKFSRSCWKREIEKTEIDK